METRKGAADFSLRAKWSANLRLLPDENREKQLVRNSEKASRSKIISHIYLRSHWFLVSQAQQAEVRAGHVPCGDR
jgi:hypothetical protein